MTAGGVIGVRSAYLPEIRTLAIPGLGPFIAAGPIMAGLAGEDRRRCGRIDWSASVGVKIPEYKAKRYEGRVKDGGILLSVHCDTLPREISRAKTILEK